MSNPAIEWVKTHPAIAASVAAGVGLVVWLITRSSSTGSSSDVAAVANSQLQQASLANQNAAVQASAQVQETQAELAAQASNNQQEAALAATVAQSQAAVQAEQIAANVSNTQTNAAESLGTTQVNAELAAQENQTNAESSALGTEFQYLTQANTNTTAEVNQLLPQLGTHTGDYSQTIGSIIEGLEGQTSSSIGLSQLAEGQTISNNSTQASEVSSLSSAAQNLLSAAFA
jgi:primosomal protein N'